MKYGILDYGMGNILSVINAFLYFGIDVIVCSKNKDLQFVDKLVIPGVGAFIDCMKRLETENFIDSLNEAVLYKTKPTLGICLGMQIMAKKSYEGGIFKGLGWFDAEVIKLQTKDKNNRVPNIGWNEIRFQHNNKLFLGIPQNADMYFVHSYYMRCNNENDIIATYNYETEITAAVYKNNIAATQFHPEKSQDYGLKVIENFINWNP